MMKRLFIITLFLIQASLIFAQQEKGYVKRGNDLYQQRKFKEAEADYRKSVEKQNQNVEGNFNLGDALYKQKKFTDASEQFNKLAGSSANKNVVAGAYHNLGNSFLENKKLEDGIAAYKKALLNNPKDEETRYNLAYAQEKLKQQQQQQQKQNQDQNKKDQQNKDKQNQDKKNQDKQNQNQQDQNKKDQQRDKDQQPQPNNISKDDAQRMLDALNNDEKETQDKLKNKKLKGSKMHIEKDW